MGKKKMEKQEGIKGREVEGDAGRKRKMAERKEWTYNQNLVCHEPENSCVYLHTYFFSFIFRDANKAVFPLFISPKSSFICFAPLPSLPFPLPLLSDPPPLLLFLPFTVFLLFPLVLSSPPVLSIFFPPLPMSRSPSPLSIALSFLFPFLYPSLPSPAFSNSLHPCLPLSHLSSSFMCHSFLSFILAFSLASSSPLCPLYLPYLPPSLPRPSTVSYIPSPILGRFRLPAGRNNLTLPDVTQRSPEIPAFACFRFG